MNFKTIMNAVSCGAADDVHKNSVLVKQLSWLWTGTGTAMGKWLEPAHWASPWSVKFFKSNTSESDYKKAYDYLITETRHQQPQSMVHRYLS